ncbi:MAG: hypothetical protein Q9213_006841 [Squamulea squamosa]
MEPGAPTEPIQHICKWVVDVHVNRLCNQIFDSTKALQEHLHWDHCVTISRSTSDVSPSCRWDGCNRYGESLRPTSALVRHALTHSNYRAYACSSCGKRYYFYSDQMRHERIHQQSPPTATNPKELQQHPSLRRTHSVANLDVASSEPKRLRRETNIKELEEGESAFIGRLEELKRKVAELEEEFARCWAAMKQRSLLLQDVGQP